MTRLERILMHGGTVILGVTGVAYAGFKHLMEKTDPFSAYNHPLQPWTLTLHVLAAPVLVFAVGAIFKDHVLARMKQRASGSMKRTGLATMSLVVPLIVSGYLIQVFAADTARDWSAWIHLGLGIAFLAFYLGHVVGMLRRAAARRTASEGSAAGDAPDAPPATIWGRKPHMARGAGRFPAPYPHTVLARSPHRPSDRSPESHETSRNRRRVRRRPPPSS